MQPNLVFQSVGGDYLADYICDFLSEKLIHEGGWDGQIT